MSYYHDLLDESNPRPDLRLVRGFLSPFSILYRGITAARNKGYDAGLLQIKKAPVKVISIGNLTTGGTGKTPLVLHLAARLTQAGKKVAVVSRGYKRKGAGTLAVSDGQNILAAPGVAGDEPWLLAGRLPGVPVVVDADRYRAACFAYAQYRPDLVLADDAFQHRRLHRDMNILVIDATAPLGTGRLLPRGTLREPVSALSRADLVVLTRINQTDDPDQVTEQLKPYTGSRPLIRCSCVTDRMLNMDNKTSADLTGKRVLLVSGIGHPASFKKSVDTTGLDIAGHLAYPDHHPFSDADLKDITNLAQAKSADLILTTEKDAVRLPASLPDSLPVYALTIRLECDPDPVQYIL